MQSKEQMTVASGVKNPDESPLEEAVSEAKSRHALNETLEFIQEAVLTAAGPKAAPLSPDEASLVDEAKAKVNEVIRGVDALLEGIHTPMLRNELLLTISDALVFAYILGNYSTPSESIRKLYESQHRREQGQSASRSNATKARERHKELRDAILAVSKPRELIASYSYAELIRKSVLQHLGITSGSWPSERTIERAISAILKECGESRRHS
jgi:hypothetical protein